MNTTTRTSSVYTFHTTDPDGLCARLVAGGFQIQDHGSRSISVRLSGGDSIARETAAAVEHSGEITTGLGIHRRTIA